MIGEDDWMLLIAVFLTGALVLVTGAGWAYGLWAVATGWALVVLCARVLSGDFL